MDGIRRAAPGCYVDALHDRIKELEELAEAASDYYPVSMQQGTRRDESTRLAKTLVKHHDRGNMFVERKLEQPSQEKTTMNGSIPVLTVEGVGMAETWENSMLRLYEGGCDVRTEYDDKNKDGTWTHPPSRDCTMIMTVLDPESEPAIHRAFPGGLEDLEEYRQEVIDGIKDHWVRDLSDPDDKRWEYTYHQRLTRYRALIRTTDHRGCVGADRIEIDQLQKMIDKLASSPYSRRANVSTWQPWCDPDCFDPPCLQSVWCRILPDDNDVWRLNMNVRFRSRDAFDAAYMNVFAFCGPQGLQGSIARRIAEKAGREVRCGRYCDLSDSYHIYGRRLRDFEEGFLKLVKTRSFEDRTWTREFAQPIFEEAKLQIVQKVADQDAKYKKE